jgi:hypothetical protein
MAHGRYIYFLHRRQMRGRRSAVIPCYGVIGNQGLVSFTMQSRVYTGRTRSGARNIRDTGDAPRACGKPKMRLAALGFLRSSSNTRVSRVRRRIHWLERETLILSRSRRCNRLFSAFWDLSGRSQRFRNGKLNNKYLGTCIFSQ